MNCFPSPPSSPVIPNNNNEKVICGSCDKPLSNDWFCSSCHTKCSLCNRFLNDTEYCTRCWSFDHDLQGLVRKELSSFHQEYARQFYIMCYSQSNSKSSQQHKLCIA
ncbi:hypothetical protein A0J61_10483 [Choanephora cucurbitarum]|uniref:Uncharacterized protein n=1 Tax=Choanephora cucurbitarum TaxID=101091 RepID=A0A1C7MXA2_9FUNG|nr:hypothetical protein A0J61_10483 [Choanephora cucurbitarum]